MLSMVECENLFQINGLSLNSTSFIEHPYEVCMAKYLLFEKSDRKCFTT